MFKVVIVNHINSLSRVIYIENIIKLLGGFSINQKKLIEIEKNPEFWIHRIDFKKLKLIDKEKILGAKSSRAVNIIKIKPKDKILFFTRMSEGKNRNLFFIGYGLVEETFDKNKKYLGFDKSKRKIKLKGIKYFNEPIFTKDISNNLDFVKNKKNSSNYFESEYRSIPESDFKKILKKQNLISDFPNYFEKLSYTTDEFLMNSIEALLNLVKMLDNSNQIEIKKFLHLLHKLVAYYGVSKSYDEIERFYSLNIWKLKLEHTSSRNPDNFVELYDPRGNSYRFGYIRLK
jgi:predicted RNA-binding protein